MPKSIESEYVFTNKHGKPFTDIKDSFHTALKKACINDFRFHDLRHTFASHLVMSGIDITTVKDLLGHKTLAITLRNAHLTAGHKKKAVNTLDKIMRKTELEDFGHNLDTISETQPRDSSHKLLI